MINELNSFLTGWVAYFRHARCEPLLRYLDKWIRRKLRCVRITHCKRPKGYAAFLRGCGVPPRRAWGAALSGKGWWRKASSFQAHEAMSLAWFNGQGLVPTLDRYLALQTDKNRRGT